MGTHYIVKLNFSEVDINFRYRAISAFNEILKILRSIIS